MNTEKLRELMSVRDSVRTELCAALRDGQQPWSEVDKHPSVKRFDTLFAGMDALLARLEAADRLRDSVEKVA